jgi:excisionase family DNA binding protein
MTTHIVYEPNDFFDTFTVKAVATKFGVGERIARSWIASGKLRGKKIGRSYFVTKAAIKEFIAAEDEVNDTDEQG